MGRDSATARATVAQARARGQRRSELLGLPARLTGEYRGSSLRTSFAPDPEAVDVLSAAIRTGRLSARGADRVLRVAWSLVDLDGLDRPGIDHVGRALTLRTGGIDDG